MLTRNFFPLQIVKSILFPPQKITQNCSKNIRASFSVLNYTEDQFILPLEQRPNYYNVYDDDEIFNTSEVKYERTEEFDHNHEDNTSDVYNSTIDDEVL